jgi:hypothetical protein
MDSGPIPLRPPIGSQIAPIENQSAMKESVQADMRAQSTAAIDQPGCIEVTFFRIRIHRSIQQGGRRASKLSAGS